MALILFKWSLSAMLLLASAFPVGAGSGQAYSFHPFYISVTEVNHNRADKTLEISCKIFADDLEETLEKSYKTQLDISAEKDKAN
ncbi:MAG TPA: DUF6702 family protein, partial [Flavisolibacter sp.]|nr:DUF6702 family protein [Flavisolibacter sp.]